MERIREVSYPLKFKILEAPFFHIIAPLTTTLEDINSNTDVTADTYIALIAKQFSRYLICTPSFMLHNDLVRLVLLSVLFYI